MQFVPWQAAVSNRTTVRLSHPVFDIPSPTKLNTVVLADLDLTMAMLDRELTSILIANDQIDSLTTRTAMISSDYTWQASLEALAYSAAWE